jgi:hypothetical protein
VGNNTTLHQWHANRNIIRNEQLDDAMKPRIGYFSFHNHRWMLVNEKLPVMKDLIEDREIPPGSMVELTNEKRLLLGGRIAIVSIANV